jgi:hypothetical protein
MGTGNFLEDEKVASPQLIPSSGADYNMATDYGKAEQRCFEKFKLNLDGIGIEMARDSVATARLAVVGCE